MASSEVKIKVDKVFKIFGQRPDEALSALHGGDDKAEVLRRTGCVVGLRNIDFSIHAGETFVIMGLSGSGKSTLIRHFNRLIEPTSGRLFFDGQDIVDLNAKDLRAFRRNKISMVFQRFGLLPHQTVLENAMLGPILQGVNHREAVARGMAQLELVGLKGFEKRYPRELSGGMQQRVGLARALATQGDVLLMDEAFSALDPLIKSDMQEQLKDIQSRLKKTIVFITHDLDEALYLGDRIAILKDGELRQVGTGEEILFKPADEYVERFVRKVDLTRALTAGQMASKVPVLQAPPAKEATSGYSTDHPGVILVEDGRFKIKSANRTDAVPAAAIDAGEPLSACFSELSKGHAVVVTRAGEPVGILSRDIVFKTLSRSSQ